MASDDEFPLGRDAEGEVPDEVTEAMSKAGELERMLGLPTPACDQCAAYQDMLKLLLEENTELHAKIMEAELGKKLAEEMLPKELRSFLLDQAKAAERIRVAKELKEQADVLGNVQGLTAPVKTGRFPSHPNIQTPPVAAIPAPPAPLGKVIDYRGVAVAVPNTITDPDNSWLMPFGKYRGRMLIEIETSYLTWCLAQDWLRPEPRQRMSNVLKERHKVRQTP